MKTEPVIGWRAWYLRHREGRLVLQSMNGGGVTRKTPFWPARRRMVARCQDGPAPHTPPGEVCTCGLYAVTSLERLRDDWSYGGTDEFAVGTVALWGDVVVADWGYRAQYGYPQMLLIPHIRWEQGRDVARDYGIAVRLWNPYTWRP
jgi:hypothetical protein